MLKISPEQIATLSKDGTCVQDCIPARLVVAVHDECNGNPVVGAEVTWKGITVTTGADGKAVFDDTTKGSGTLKVKKEYADAISFITNYPKVTMNRSIDQSASDSITVKPGENTAKLSFREPRKLTSIKIQRKYPFGSGDQYGHWWVEVGPNESYGWWPKKPVGSDFDTPPPEPPVEGAGWRDRLAYRIDSAVHSTQRATAPYRDTLSGVPGELNGTYWGGTSTRDAHHGDTPEDSFSPIMLDCETAESMAATIRAAAKLYAKTHDTWSYRYNFGNSCHTMQQELMDAAGVKLVQPN